MPLEDQEEIDSEELSEEEVRSKFYEQYDVSQRGQLAIKYILPLLDRSVQTESRYDIDIESKVLAEISLYQAYEQEPKFKIFSWAAIILGSYDILHTFSPQLYGIIFIGLATVNGFLSSLRSPAMMAAELEGKKDEKGMPADYRAKALSSVNTNITLVLFVIAIGIQSLVTSSVIQGELIAQNFAEGYLNPTLSAIALFLMPLLIDWIKEDGE